MALHDSTFLQLPLVATVPILTLAFIGEGRGCLQDSHQFLIGIEGGVGDLNDATRQMKFSEKKVYVRYVHMYR